MNNANQMFHGSPLWQMFDQAWNNNTLTQQQINIATNMGWTPPQQNQPFPRPQRKKPETKGSGLNLTHKRSGSNPQSGSYCLCCKKNTGNKNQTKYTTKNGQPMMKSKCTECGKGKCRFLPKLKGKGAIETLFTGAFHMGNAIAKSKRKK